MSTDPMQNFGKDGMDVAMKRSASGAGMRKPSRLR